MKIIVWGCWIAQMKRLDAMITTQKISTFCNVPLLKKSRTTPKNYNFFKNDRFGVFFPDFLSNGTVLRVGVSCVVTMAALSTTDFSISQSDHIIVRVIIRN